MQPFCFSLPWAVTKHPPLVGCFTPPRLRFLVQETEAPSATVRPATLKKVLLLLGRKVKKSGRTLLSGRFCIASAPRCPGVEQREGGTQSGENIPLLSDRRWRIFLHGEICKSLVALVLQRNQTPACTHWAPTFNFSPYGGMIVSFGALDAGAVSRTTDRPRKASRAVSTLW
jgi:hypothetical protein